MGWTVDTYAGTLATGTPAAWRTALFEICRAVNERQSAVGIGKTTFYKEDGTLASDISSADLIGVWVSGTNTYLYQNLVKVQSAIANMVNSEIFTVTSGKSTAYTKASLESASGADLTEPPTSAQNAEFWQGLRDALNLLIYAKKNFPASGIDYSYKVARTSAYATVQDCWDAMVADGASTETSAFEGCRYSYSESTLSTCHAKRAANYECPIYTIDGVISEAYYKYTVIEVPSATLTGSMEMTVGITALNSPSVSGEILSSGGIAMDSDNSFTQDYAIPETIPLDITEDTVNRYGVEINSIDVYFDIASVLTDQA